MGHQVGQTSHPRRGSLAFSPRVRAKRIYPRIKNWPKINETKLLGLAGYKAGMSFVTYIDNAKNSPTKGEKILVPVTIIDIPPIKAGAIKFYGLDKRRYKVCLGEVWTDNLDKDLARKISLPKKKENPEDKIKQFEDKIDELKDITVLVYTLPQGRCGKKKPEIFEVAIGGENVSDKLNYAKSLLGNEINIRDIVKEGDQIDVIAVTKGKGFQGTVKRFGVKMQKRYKTDRTTRGVASIGPDVPRKVSWRVPMPGQMGFHNRWDYNKRVLLIGENGEEINPKSGFRHYGLIRGRYMIIEGSVPGAIKRLVRFRLAMHPKNLPKEAPKIIDIGTKV